MPTPESLTKKAIKKILDDTPGVWYFMPPANGYGRAGIPDFICCVNGCFFAIEAKAGRGKTTALQDRELERITQAQGFALVVYDTADSFQHLGTQLELLQLRGKQ